MKKYLLIVGLLIALALTIYVVWVYVSENGTDETGTASVATSDLLPKPSLGEQLVDIFYLVDLPNLETINDPPDILGDDAADNRIRELAENRGYRLQARVEDEDLLRPVADYYLQPGVVEAWERLEAAAEEEGFGLGLRLGYRSIPEQRELFVEELSDRAKARIGRDFTTAQVAGGTADAVINSILRDWAIPGYSKFQTGYAISLVALEDGEEIDDFSSSGLHAWLTKGNYQQAREFGFIPSYPDGAEPQGPDSRFEEYVWVGVGEAMELDSLAL